MAASNYSAHVGISTTFQKQLTTTPWLKSNAVPFHVSMVFIALIIGSVSCVIITVLFMIIKRRGFPFLRRSRGDSGVIDGITISWKPKSTKLKIQNNVEKPDNGKQTNESNMQITDIDEEDEDDDDDEDDDIYLDPKNSELSDSQSNSKISVSANNFALQTHNVSVNGYDELIEGHETFTYTECNHNDKYINICMDLNEYNEDDYDWIEMALRSIDATDWSIYLKRFKQNKVNVSRLHSLMDDDFRELLPEIGIRRDFRNLLKNKNTNYGIN